MNTPHWLGVMKESRAVVSTIRRDGIAVTLGDACEKTTACHGCSLCSPHGRTVRRFCPVSRPAAYARGQRVHISYFSINQALAAGIAFGLPLACALAAYCIWMMGRRMAEETPGAVLAALGGLAAGVVLVCMIDRALQRNFPVTIRADATAEYRRPGRLKEE